MEKRPSSTASSPAAPSLPFTGTRSVVLQKKPRSRSQAPPRSLPPEMGESKRTPTFLGLSSKMSATAPRCPGRGPLACAAVSLSLRSLSAEWLRREPNASLNASLTSLAAARSPPPPSRPIARPLLPPTNCTRSPSSSIMPTLPVPPPLAIRRPIEANKSDERLCRLARESLPPLRREPTRMRSLKCSTRARAGRSSSLSASASSSPIILGTSSAAGGSASCALSQSKKSRLALRCAASARTTHARYFSEFFGPVSSTRLPAVGSCCTCSPSCSAWMCRKAVWTSAIHADSLM
mmetsp:Transcript_3966/g.12405  ORF Transcript_3966/g.12405 Transcript_3966/m.12405 type:complete len:293 (-) Transcript_3966:2059-2937(-)